MGCHTWFFRKENRSIEEARRLYLNNKKAEIKMWNNMLINPEDEIKTMHRWSDEFIEWTIKVLERQNQMVTKGLCDVAVMNNQLEHSHYIKDKGFYVTDDLMPHDIFRTSGYPDIHLFSLDETYKFIYDNIDKVHMENKESSFKQLDYFWTQFEDGMIIFG